MRAEQLPRVSRDPCEAEEQEGQPREPRSTYRPDPVGEHPQLLGAGPSLRRRRADAVRQLRQHAQRARQDEQDDRRPRDERESDGGRQPAAAVIRRAVPEEEERDDERRGSGRYREPAHRPPGAADDAHDAAGALREPARQESSAPRDLAGST
jgi:hypothetical protein